MATFRSLQFTIVVLVAIMVVSVLGTLIPQGQPWEFYEANSNPAVQLLVKVFRFDDTYRSPLFLGLLGLFAFNLALCTLYRFPGLFRTAFRADPAPSREEMERMPVSFSFPASIEALRESSAEKGFRLKDAGESRLFGEKGWIGYFGATIVHIGILIILAGGVTSILTGKRGHITLRKGESTSLVDVSENRKIPLGFTVSLDSFRVAFYESHPDRPKSFTSSVTVSVPGGTSFKKDIRVNRPLMLKGFTLFQSSYGLSEGTDASSDTALVAAYARGAEKSPHPLFVRGMVVGDTFPVPRSGDSLTVRLGELHRDFRMGGGSDKPNPAVRLDVLVRGEDRWNVYAFQNMPGLNMPMNQDIPISFTLVEIYSGSRKPPGSAPEYHTVLGAVRDRGIPLVWSGAAIMMAGLCISFLFRPKKIWALGEGGAVHLSARTRGDHDDLRAFVAGIVKSAGQRSGSGDKQ